MNNKISKWMSLAALKEEMTMKEQFLKWISFLGLMAFVAVVFMIVDGCYWLGIILIGAGAGFASLAAKKKANDSSEDDEVFCEDPILPDVLTDSPEQDAAAWIRNQ